MAIIYYPASASVTTRTIVNGNPCKSLYIGVSPNNIFFFDTASQLSAISSSVTDAISASYALSASYASNGGSGGTTLLTGSLVPITSSQANTSSWAVTSTDVLPVLTALSSSVTYSINFTGSRMQQINLTNNASFTGSEYIVGKTISVRMYASSSTYNLFWPSSWHFLGASSPASLSASRFAMLSLTAYGVKDADIIAAWAAEP